jgi:hypothetical protein
MRVRKRNGPIEPVDVNKIVRAASRCCLGVSQVDALRVATRTISGLYDGATTRELDQLSIRRRRRSRPRSPSTRGSPHAVVYDRSTAVVVGSSVFDDS